MSVFLLTIKYSWNLKKSYKINVDFILFIIIIRHLHYMPAQCALVLPVELNEMKHKVNLIA